MPQIAIVTDTTACLLSAQIAEYRIVLVLIERRGLLRRLTHSSNIKSNRL